MVILLIVISLTYIISCTSVTNDETLISTTIHREGQTVLNDKIDQVSFVAGQLIINDETSVAYGIDFKKRRPFLFSLETGDFQFLSTPGRGPAEVTLPNQLIAKNDSTILLYDVSQDAIAIFKNNVIVDKRPGFLSHNVWLRNAIGFFWNGHVITAIEEPEKVLNNQILDSRPLALLNLEKNILSFRGRVSPTIDELDNTMKHPMIVLNSANDDIFYVYYADHTVMRHNLKTDNTDVFSTYVPRNYRKRSEKASLNLPPTRESARTIGLDMTNVIGLDIYHNMLFVVWQNLLPSFYELGSSDSHIDFFGVLYDLESGNIISEIDLPGRYLGRYKNMMLIQENEDPLHYQIGWYSIERKEKEH